MGFSPDPFGGFMFSVFPVIFIVVFLLIIGIFIITAVKGLGEWNRNNHQPVLTVPARIVSKREHFSTSRHGVHTNDIHHHHHHSSTTSYYVTFEVESGDRMEFHVPPQEYGILIDGDNGKLTFQGTRYHKFERFKNTSFD